MMLRVRGAGCMASKEDAAAAPKPSEVAVVRDIDLGEVLTQDLDSVAIEAEAAHEEVLRELRLLDEKLAASLQRGDIRLLRTSWLLGWASAANHGSLLLSRQGLEALEAASDDGGENSPLLPPKEAVALIHCADRRVGILSHGWLTASHCDPEGARLAVVVRALEQYPQLQALFWDYASMYQRPRTDDQDGTFRRALDVMGDLCMRRAKEPRTPGAL